jgi:hypothetical protein
MFIFEGQQIDDRAISRVIRALVSIAETRKTINNEGEHTLACDLLDEMGIEYEQDSGEDET